jgi:hypothetical protein
MDANKNASSSPGLRSFMASTPKHKSDTQTTQSRMEPYWAEIKKLSLEGYSLSRIQEYLKTVNVEVSRTAIHKFVSFPTQARK